jgi:hypothetical protein
MRVLGSLAVAAGVCLTAAGQGKLMPGAMPRVATVDERFQSYNIEMVEVTGGRFWKPYASKAASAGAPSGNQPVGMDPSLYEYRPPIDLSKTRLRKLAAALGPAYVRVSGTWANSTYFQGPDEAVPEKAPAGFNGVLTQAEWRGVVEFAKAANAELVTSFAISAGTRGADGVWTLAEAKKVLAATKADGGRIAAAEWMNEPTFAMMGGAPKGFDAAAFARDFAVFRGYVKEAEPGMVVLGPGGVGEGSALVPAGMATVSTEKIFTATGPVFDAVSYHSYGGVSSRCSAGGVGAGTTEAAALSEEWLGRAGTIEAFYAGLRDKFEPGKPIWNTETAQTACGGDRWAATFLDSFRYLNQLGVLAKRGVQVHMHNTLAASDYGLLDEKTYEPRPNYWAALLWRRLMGTTVLDAGAGPAPTVHLFAQCLRGGSGKQAGGVTLLAINLAGAETLETAAAAEQFTLTAEELTDKTVKLNGRELVLGPEDALPELRGERVKAGRVTLPATSITFLTFPEAKNANCR